MLLFIFSLVIGTLAHAQRFTPVVQPIGTAEKIVVKGFKGNLQLVSTESGTLKVEAENKGPAGNGWTFEVSQNQNSIEIRLKSGSAQQGWDQVRSKTDVPSFDMKITAPRKAIEIFWNEGQVLAESWKSDLNLQMTTGNAKITKGEGDLQVQLLTGRLEISEHLGNISLQTFKGQTLISKTNGALSINNHSARCQFNEHEGPLEIRNHSGSTTLAQIKGNVTVKNVSGAVSLSDFEGSFSGDFSKGALDAKVTRLQNFSVNSGDATVTLDAPKDSGAIVSLRTEKGKLWAPLFLQRLKKGRWQERKGRLKGKEQGNIKIISKYGDIVLK